MLNVNVKRQGSIAILDLQGQIVNGQTDILRNAVESLSGVNAIKLDLARVNTVDAGGLGAMLKLRERAELMGVRFELMNLTKQIRRVFEITRLDSVFRITAAIQFFPARKRASQVPATRLVSCA